MGGASVSIEILSGAVANRLVPPPLLTGDKGCIINDDDTVAKSTRVHDDNTDEGVMEADKAKVQIKRIRTNLNSHPSR
jgi:hypothetical protein